MNEIAGIPQLLNQALQHHQAGRLALAEQLYQQALAADPNHPEALHLLGVLKHQTGESNVAIELISRSVQQAPTFASLSNLGEILRSRGQLADAVACLRRSIEMKSDWPDTYGNLGLALMDLRQFAQAEQAFSRAIQLAPQRPEMHVRLARAKLQQDDAFAAISAARRATELQPAMAEAWAVLALALSAALKHDQALESGRRAVELAPHAPEAHINFGIVQAAAGDKSAALTSYERAVALAPRHPIAHRNMAAALDMLGRYQEASAAITRALELNPNDLEGWLNLSSLRRRLRDHVGAVAAAEHVLKMQPDHAGAHGNLGLSLLALGDYARGFKEYEWRWLCANFTTKPREFDRPAWNGSDPSGRTIFVHHEQGLGDMIQFARYVPMLAARGATIILEAPVLLRSLMNSLPGVQRVIAAGTRPPGFDLHVPLLSLPRIFGTTYNTIPADIPYLSASADRLNTWKQRLDALGGRMKVGLVWAGNPQHVDDAQRSMKPSHLADLAGLTDIVFVSLQKRDNPLASEALPAGLEVVDVSQDLNDFADTAAAMMHLDLTLTIDSATAHLAGALARTVWTLLAYAADWRWKDDGDSTPWYPTMRLFRQPSPGDWPAVIRSVRDALLAHAKPQ
jgi:tetratricopeptide (TPR) repeat protein